MENKAIAPVALFVYNRLDNTKKTVEALQKNKLAEQTVLYIFSDGGKDSSSWKKVNRVRDYIQTIRGFKAVYIVMRPENYYLERNVIEGIAEVLKHHDRIIVMEDDIITSPYFLRYMNDALDYYKDVPRVWHVSSFTYFSLPEWGDTYFCNYMSGYGAWATWRDCWQLHFRHFKSRQEALDGITPELLEKIEKGGNFHGLDGLDRTPIPWDICWLLQIYKANALCLTPTHTLVKNIGLGGGTHTNQHRIFGWYVYDRNPRMTPITVGGIPVEEHDGIEQLLQEVLFDHGIRYNWFGRIVRYFYLRLCRRNRK